MLAYRRRAVQISRISHYRWLKLQAVALMALGRRSAATIRLGRMLTLQPNDQYALASQAHLQAEQHDFNAAIASLQRLTAAWPLDAAAWFNLGYSLQQASRHAQAESAFRSALVLDPLMDRAWYGLGLALIHRRQFYEAAEAFKKNTSLQPLSPHGWYRLAEVWLALDQPAEAQKVLHHLQQFEPAVARQLAHQHRALSTTFRAVDGNH